MSIWDGVIDVAGDVGGAFVGDPMLGNQIDMGVNLLDPSLIGNGAGATGAVGAAGAAGAAGGAAGANAALTQEQLSLQANSQNQSGQAQYQSQVNQQRQNALRNLALQSAVDNPRTSPFDPAGPVQYSPQFKSTLATLGGQSQGLLANPAPSPTFTPLPINAGDLQKVTGTAPSPLSTIGAGLSAAAGLAGKGGSTAPTATTLPIPGFNSPNTNGVVAQTPNQTIPGAQQGSDGFQLPFTGFAGDPSFDPTGGSSDVMFG